MEKDMLPQNRLPQMVGACAGPRRPDTGHTSLNPDLLEGAHPRAATLTGSPMSPSCSDRLLPGCLATQN